MKQAMIRAVEGLLREDASAEISMAAIAAKAKVNYTTVSRGWNELRQPIAALRVARLMSDIKGLGESDGDDMLQVWARSFAERLSIFKLDPGTLNDLVQALDEGVRKDLERLSAKAASNGLTLPPLDVLVVKLVAPIVYRRLAGNPDDVSPFLGSLLAAL